MLFKNYPQITYRIGSKDITLVDIFKNIAFTNVENNNAFDDYYIQDGESPENISAKIYGSTSYAWIILLVNNIVHIKNDWFISASEFDQRTQSQLGGDAIYIAALPDIQPGDIMVKVLTETDGFAQTVDIQNYRHVAEFDRNLRKVRGISGAGNITLGNLVVFARLNADGSVVPLQFNNQAQTPTPTDFTNVIHTEKYINSVDYFITGNNVVLNPYLNIGYPGPSGISPSTTFVDASAGIYIKDNFADTLLFYYMDNGGVLPAGVSKVSVGTENYNKYIENQKIRILKPELLSTVISAIENALNGDNVGKIFKVEL